jgi:hypothetical protein
VAVPRLPGRLYVGIALLVLGGMLGCSSLSKPPAKSPLRCVWTSPTFAGSVWTSSSSHFSPDNSRLAVSVHSFPGKKGQYRIMVVREGEAAYVSRGSKDFDPDWNPRSQEVAYLDQSEGLEKNKLTVVDTKTGASRDLKTPAGSYGPPRWSPDGNSLAFGARLYYAGEEPAATGLVIADARGGSVRTVPMDDMFYHLLYPPAWSADSKKVLLIDRGPVSDGCGIWQANLTQGSAKLVWSLDGITKNFIAISSMTRGKEGEAGRDVMVGFDQTSGDPCLMVCGFPAEEATLLRYDTRAKREVKVATLSLPAGAPSAKPRTPPVLGQSGKRSHQSWGINAAVLSPDGKGLATVCHKRSRRGKDVLLWFYDGQSGQQDLPAGVAGSVLCWSRDSKRFAIAEEQGEKTSEKRTKVSVYELGR